MGKHKFKVKIPIKILDEQVNREHPGSEDKKLTLDFDVAKGTIAFRTADDLMSLAEKKITIYFETYMHVARDGDYQQDDVPYDYEVPYSMKTAAQYMSFPPASEFVHTEEGDQKVENIYEYLVENPEIRAKT